MRDPVLFRSVVETNLWELRTHMRTTAMQRDAKNLLLLLACSLTPGSLAPQQLIQCDIIRIIKI